MPEPKPKPRRSIFDTLKKSADGRLGLAEAANLADKISVFPVRHQEPQSDPTLEPTLDPAQAPTLDPTVAPTPPSAQVSGQPSDQLSDRYPGQESGQYPAQSPKQGSGRDSGHVSGQPSEPRSGRVSAQPTRQPSGRVSGHEPTLDPSIVPQPDPSLLHAPTPEPTPAPSFAPTGAPTPVSGDDSDMRRIIRSLPENKRRFLHFLIDNEPAGDDYIVSRNSVAKSLHLTEISVKRYFAEFADLGFYHKETYRRGVCQGLRLFLVRSRCQAFKRLDPMLDLTPVGSREPSHDPTSGHFVGSDPTVDPKTDPTLAPSFNKEERKKDSLSLSSERIALTWPHLHRAGFGPEQLAQIATSLAELGKAADKVVSGLDHAEWELANGSMRDKDGNTVLDPCSWVFRSLARTGYYRRPKGYVSAEEQAARDAEEEARAVATARQKAEQAAFEAWRDGLAPETLAAAMRGFPGGPRDAWLKAYWRKTR